MHLPVHVCRFLRPMVTYIAPFVFIQSKLVACTLLQSDRMWAGLDSRSQTTIKSGASSSHVSEKVFQKAVQK